MTPQDFLTFANSLPEPALLLTGEGIILAANRSTESRLGNSPADLVNRPLMELVSDSPEEVQRYLRKCSRNSQMILGVLQWKQEDGSLACRAEGAVLSPAAEEEPARLILRVTPKQSHSSHFVSLNLRIEQLNREIRLRRDAEAIARKEEEFLRTTLASVGDGVIVTDGEGRILSMNSVAHELTGWKEQEAEGNALEMVFRVVNEHTRAVVENPVLRALEKGEVVGLANHTILIARDGSERPIDDSAAPIRDRDGQIVGCVLVFRDVTQRHHAEKALKESERLHQDLYENAPDLMFSVDAETLTITHCNQTLAKELGFEKEEVVGQPVLKFYDTESRTNAERSIRQWLETGRSDINLFRLRRKDGSVMHVSLRSSAQRDEEGRILSSRSVWRDVTRLIETEEALGISRERLAFVLQATGVGTWYNDLPLNKLQWDDRTRELFHVPPGVTPTLDLFLQSLHPDDREPTMRASETAIRDCGFYSMDHRVVNPVTGEIRWVRSQGRVLCQEDGTPLRFGGVNYDITAQKQTEAELKDTAARLSEADRRKDEFLATLAHELRNPLAPIRMGLEIMKMAKNDPAVIEKTRATMERQTQQLITLVDDLLDVSRITRNKLDLRKDRVKLRDVIQSAVEASRPAIEQAGHELIIGTPGKEIQVEADPHRLTQVLSNLLNNAAKYTEPGGRIELVARQLDGEVVISVKDNGIGIPVEMLDRIFEMFAQVDRPMEKGYMGLGIGLTLVKSLVEMHGGRVEVSSEGPGQGSQFSVYLPVLNELRSNTTPLPASGVLPAGPARKVLVVDDNHAAAETLSTAVRMLGHEVRTASDGHQAIRAAAEFRPDVVLMDLGMPNMNGYEAARLIRQQSWGRNMLLIAITGWGQEDARLRSRQAGFNEHLLKGAEPAELRRVLSMVEEKSR